MRRLFFPLFDSSTDLTGPRSNLDRPFSNLAISASSKHAFRVQGNFTIQASAKTSTDSTLNLSNGNSSLGKNFTDHFIFF